MLKKRKQLFLALCRLEEGQQRLLERLDRMGMLKTDAAHSDDGWVQTGIDNILSYSVEKTNVRADEEKEA